MLIVETVSPEGIASQAGVQPGDQLLSYAGQKLLSPFHLQALEENTFSDQPLVLELLREDQTWETAIAAGKLGLRARPEMSEEMLALYEHARRDQQAGRVNQAAQQLEQAARQAAESGETGVSLYLFIEAGISYEQMQAWEQALKVYEAGRQAGTSGEYLATQVQVHLKSGRCYEQMHAYEKAINCYEQAGQLAEQGMYERWVAGYIHHLGHIAYIRGNFALAQEYFLRALAIKEKLAPGSLEMAGSLHNIGAAILMRGNLSLAQDYILRALAIFEKLAPGSLEMAGSLMGLGGVAHDRGNLSSAQDYYLRALAIQEKLAPGSLNVALSLNNLGNVAFDRGDLALARDYHLRALAIYEKLDPSSLHVAASLNNLGNVAHRDGDLILAQNYHMLSLAIRENLAPDSWDVASSLNNLGGVAWGYGDLASARDYYSRSLAILERQAPDSMEVAKRLNNLGNVAYNGGDLSSAQKYHSHALAVRQKLAPDSLELAESLEKIGRVYLRQQMLQQALPYLQQSMDLVEKQRAAIQVTEARALLLAQHASTFLTLVQAYLALDQQHDAFSVLERWRARSLSELLAERHLFLLNAPQELLQQQEQLNQQRSQAYTALAKLSLADQEQITQLHTHLHTLERQQQELTARIRATSPGYAALHYPQPLDAKATQSVLETGTLLLSFLVGEEQTYLFTVSKKEIVCYELSIGQKALQERVSAFREALLLQL